MSEVSQARDAIKTAFWVSDVMTNDLPDMLTSARQLEENAPSSGASDLANELIQQIEGMAVALGILREALATIAMATREGSA